MLTSMINTTNYISPVTNSSGLSHKNMGARKAKVNHYGPLPNEYVEQKQKPVTKRKSQGPPAGNVSLGVSSRGIAGMNLFQRK